MNEPTVIFIHLPKASGSTLNRIIAQQVPPGAILKVGGKSSAETFAEVRTATSRAQNPARVITGHWPFGLHAAVPDGWRYITLLREPVERLLSQFYFVQRLATHPLHAAVTSGEMTPVDFARRIPNSQARYLAGEGPFASDTEILERARKHLTECAVVGVTERFHETLILLERALGWRVRGYTDANVTKNRPCTAQHTAAELDAIRECHQLDLELHRLASERVAREVAEAGPAFARKVAWLRLRCRVVTALRGARKAGAT